MQSTLLARFAPPGGQSETFARSASALVVGVAAGGPLAGVLVEASGPRAALVDAVVVAVLTVVAALGAARVTRAGLPTPVGAA